MSNATRMFTIVVASGTSQRFGSNKLNEVIGRETILDRSVRIAKESSDGVVVVTDPSSYHGPDVDAVVAGGATRSQSVKNGLAAVPFDVEIIAIHDAARPGATTEMYSQGRTLIEKGNVAAIPAVDVVDTIKTVDGISHDRVVATVDRSTLRAVQTPQVFLARIVRAAHAGETIDTDDAALVEKMGHDVLLFQGSQENRKVTTKEDLTFIRALLGHNEISRPDRMGMGYDIHPFGTDPNKKLVLGGVTFDYFGLAGHSDSDAVAHALTDALLSAIGGPDLGTLFPASDQANKNVSSLEFLSSVVTGVYNEGYVITNASIVVNAQMPKLAPHRDEMIKMLAECMSPIMNEDSIISLTPKHGEGVGEIGKAEAIAVYATVLLSAAKN
jgi:2-C-methyl-D-erythritol 4-phosphate cytidylyltransferase/2-C-methyl-D-erythritol 2,4-cyclodiphosphate synthase